LFKQMNTCNARQVGDFITIRPLNHVKLEAWSGDGISETDYVIIPVSASDEELGNAVIEAFSRCKGRQF
ncbi:MAG: contact-dependent growth inhibition system immunity protein, partial [Morganella morganii]